MREVNLVPWPFYPGKGTLRICEVFWLKSLRSDTNRHTCWEGLSPQDLFSWFCAVVSLCPTWVALFVMAAQSWCFQRYCDWPALTVHLQLVLCTEPERFVADCCAFVRFSAWQKPGQCFEHAFGLCTIPLILHNMLSAVMLSVCGCLMMHFA